MYHFSHNLFSLTRIKDYLDCFNSIVSLAQVLPGLDNYSLFHSKGNIIFRAFVSGEFNDAGLTDDVEGLSYQDYIGLDEW